jgi:hypothetical protein
MSKKPDWKRTERKIAAQLGGRRVPVTGRARGDAPDVAHDWLAIEVKHKARLPDWLHDAMARGLSAGGALVSVLFLRPVGAASRCVL